MAGPTSTELDARVARIIASRDQLAADGIGVTSVAADEARARLTSSTDPFFGGFGWTLSALPGETITGRVSVEFPAPAAVPSESNVYVHVWVGPGSVDPDLGTYLLNADPRFPRLSEPKVPGLQPGYTQVPEFPTAPDRSLLNFDLPIPADATPSVYLGNMCLLRLAPFGIGDVLGRGSFAFRVRSPGEPPDLNPSFTRPDSPGPAAP